MTQSSNSVVRTYLEIRGGVLVAAYSDAPNVELIVLDWDNSDGEAPTGQRMSVDVTANMPKDTRFQFPQPPQLAPKNCL